MSDVSSRKASAISDATAAIAEEAASLEAYENAQEAIAPSPAAEAVTRAEATPPAPAPARAAAAAVARSGNWKRLRNVEVVSRCRALVLMQSEGVLYEPSVLCELHEALCEGRPILTVLLE